MWRFVTLSTLVMSCDNDYVSDVEQALTQSETWTTPVGKFSPKKIEESGKLGLFTDLKHWWLKFVQLIILPLIIVLSWGKWQTKKILFPKKNCIIYRFFLLAGWNGSSPEQFPMQKSCVHRISYFKRNHTFLLFHRSSNAEKSLFLPKSSPPSPNSAVVVHRSLARQLSTLLSCYQTLFFLKARLKKKLVSTSDHLLLRKKTVSAR